MDWLKLNRSIKKVKINSIFEIDRRRQLDRRRQGKVKNLLRIYRFGQRRSIGLHLNEIMIYKVETCF